MIKFRPFDSRDLIDLGLQEAQKEVEHLVTKDEEHGNFCMMSEMAWTGFIGDDVVGAAGILRNDDHKGQCWMVLTDREFNMREWGQISVKTKEVIDHAHDLGMWRIWACVNLGHWSGERFMKHLGFSPEGTMRHSSPVGDHEVLYAKIDFR